MCFTNAASANTTDINIIMLQIDTRTKSPTLSIRSQFTGKQLQKQNKIAETFGTITIN